jgi:ligand-binding sensor domain-containing protein
MNRVLPFLGVVLVALPATVSGRQSFLDLGRWKNYTDMRLVRGLAAGADSVWAATSGGLFLYTPSTHQFAKFTNSDGLSSNDLAAVTIDGVGRIWVGSSDGFVNSYDPRKGVWGEIRGLAESDRVQKAVRTLVARGDSLFVGTDFGISVLHISRMEFRDTYASLGFATQAGVNSVAIHQNRIWAATDLGVATAMLSAPNLSAPTAWKTYGVADGLPAANCSSVSILRDSIVIGTSAGLAVFDGKKFIAVPAFSGKSVTRLLGRSSDIVVLWSENPGFSLASYAGISSPSLPIASNTVLHSSSLCVQPSTADIWVGTTTAGIARLNNAWEYRAPNGPQSSLFVSVVVDSRGILWAASGISLRGRGFYRFDPSASNEAQWKNYSVSSYPVMKTDDYYKVSIGASGSIWASSWGAGVVEVVNDTIRRHFDQTTTPMLAGSVAVDPNYVVVGGIAVDSQGDTWIVNRTAINGNHIVQLKSDNSVVYRPSISDGKFTNIIIDQNDTKWFANAEPSDKPAGGLYYFNEDSVVAGTKSLGGWGWMSTADGLLNNTILSLAVDLNGDVWIGTDGGMVVVTDPLDPKKNRQKPLPLIGQVIQAIAVDAVNNKWVGTKAGVMVVNSDGTQLLGQYTALSTNGKLVDDDVRSIAIDHRRGIVYFGTEKGLCSLAIVPVQTSHSLTTLELGPNPFFVPSDKPLIIGNLASESTIKIVSSDGNVVTEFVAQGGGRAFWTGTDRNGRLVPSGVYFVVAYAENGNQTTTAKVAVVRR